MKFVFNKRIDTKDVVQTKKDIASILDEVEQKQLQKAIALTHEFDFDFTVAQLFDGGFDPEEEDFGVFEKFRQFDVEFWSIEENQKPSKQLVIFSEQAGCIFEYGSSKEIESCILLGDTYYEAENEEQEMLCKKLAEARENVVAELPKSRLAELDFFVLDEE